MALRITYSNISGFSANQEQASEIPSAYEILDNFSVDISFEGIYPTGTLGVDGEMTYEYKNATNVTSSFNWSKYEMTYSKPQPHIVRLQGPAVDVFIDQYYKFKMVDFTEQILPANTQQQFLGIIEYNMPNPTYIMASYPFTVTLPAGPGVPANTIETISLNQWFYWRYQVAVANIASANARGLK